MEDKLRVGLIKRVPALYDVDANLAAFLADAKRAAERGVKLLVTCECFLDGYCVADKACTRERLLACAQDAATSERIAAVRSAARAHGMHIVFGFTQRTSMGVKNAALLIDDRGCDVGVYHKTHLMTHDVAFEPGDGLPVFETVYGKWGIIICADRRFPETARTLKVRGAELIIMPTYGMWHYDNEWWMRTRSYENETTLLFAHPEVSLVCDPRGGLAAKLTSNVPDILVHDVDLSEHVNSMFPHRRPEIYQV